MKKKWFAIVSLLTMLAVLFTGLPAMAQAGTTEDITAQRPANNALEIRAPRMATVGKEVTIGVYKRGTDTPEEGAFIFALSRDSAEALREEMFNLQAEATTTAADTDYAALADVYGELIDITDENGEVHYTFNEVGWYLLIAVKPGYYPGFATIAIRPAVNALDVKAPEVAKVGEEVTIGVYERATGDPVKGALVFAVVPGATEALREEIATIRDDSIDAVSIGYEAVVSAYGELIDITDGNGEVHHAFDKAGRYLLVAVKPNYFPGFARILIIPAADALGIKALNNAPVGEEVTIGVFKRGVGEPVEGADVWALSRENAATLKDEVAALKEEAESADDIDYEALVDIHGEFIDWTDEKGEVRHTFDEAGWYLLVTVKAGHIPGFKPISIGTVPGVLGIKAPRKARVDEEVTMTIFKRRTQTSVEGAAVCAVSREKIGTLREDIAELKENNDDAAEADYEKLVSLVSEFIDWTDENGKVSHAFDEAGIYILVALKKGYFPGFAPIKILETNTVTPQMGLQSNGPRLVQPDAVRRQVQAPSVLDVARTN